ncbi:hypothetical protein ABDF71_26550 [Ochrobactrum sp. WV_118_8]|uniref:Uncharacterized protein n=1 Tax=Brucella tritici TaxID=94626 RepID=A0A7V8B0H2_9HYPH|nr:MULTISPECIES: hypothetical protein [Brucella/Ochrobactrum group]KAB2654636.1 hypothetical protein F9K94_23625 [Brucella tritici]KAB2756768.1 hypothetical protein F9K98_23770 [Brucella anthropi]KAB2773770.1 hypothetical protein F9L00_24025 [Brucella anthropi]MCQ9147857.1 hypothetical protein [Ochrobactrum sp. BTU2]MCR8494154.1 hypothetical protein [Brucella anthropi]
MDAIPVLLPGQTLQDARSMIEDVCSFRTADTNLIIEDCRAYYGDKASIMAAWFGMDAWFEGDDASKAKWATVLKHMIQ